MFQFEDADLIQDREDLIAIMRMRFGDIPRHSLKPFIN